MSRVYSLETLSARKVVRSKKPYDKNKVNASSLRAVKEATKDYNVDMRTLNYEKEKLRETKENLSQARQYLKSMMSTRTELTRTEYEDMLAQKEHIRHYLQEIRDATAYIQELKAKLK